MGAFKDGYDILKDLIKLAKEARNQEMMELAMDVQVKLIELNEENQKIKEELDFKNNIKEIERDLVRCSDGLCYRQSEIDKKILYCSACWGNNKKLIQLTRNAFPGPTFNTNICPNCKANFGRGNPFYKEKIEE